jgi:hypothetical protein
LTEAFAALCRPTSHPAAIWWRALLVFAYMTEMANQRNPGPAA